MDGSEIIISRVGCQGHEAHGGFGERAVCASQVVVTGVALRGWSEGADCIAGEKAAGGGAQLWRH